MTTAVVGGNHLDILLSLLKVLRIATAAGIILVLTAFCGRTEGYRITSTSTSISSSTSNPTPPRPTTIEMIRSIHTTSRISSSRLAVGTLAVRPWSLLLQLDSSSTTTTNQEKWRQRRGLSTFVGGGRRNRIQQQLQYHDQQYHHHYQPRCSYHNHITSYRQSMGSESLVSLRSSSSSSSSSSTSNTTTDSASSLKSSSSSSTNSNDNSNSKNNNNSSNSSTQKIVDKEEQQPIELTVAKNNIVTSNMIRDLKEQGADKWVSAPLIDELVLLEKNQLEQQQQQQQQQQRQEASATIEVAEMMDNDNSNNNNKRAELESQIFMIGNKIRTLKETGTDKSIISPLVEELLMLKAQLDPFSVVNSSSNQPTKKNTSEENNILSKNSKNNKQKNEKPTTNTIDKDSDDMMMISSLSSEPSLSEFITARSVDYSRWYNDLIQVTGLAEPSPVRGCMVIKPWGMALWDRIRIELDQIIKNHGAENAYFPLLIPKSFLAKEAEHVDGFAKECAVVTHHRLVADEVEGLIADPDAKLEEPLVIRPTSETMIWYMFRKWINSYRDLPLKINQWANVIRWEMRTRPFLRTSEFLWQEGHTAHATAPGAIDDARTMMENYAMLCETLLAMPVIRGIKSPSERFAGAEDTYTIEALMQNGWALQAGTSHFLGQSFGKAFDVTFQDENGQQQDVYGTSWGVSTRLVGALIMTHSDDAGLVLPPQIAPIQIIIVPIPPKKNDESTQLSMNTVIRELGHNLTMAGIRWKLDDRDYIRSGAKYFEWERKGVPLRIEIGPRDIQQNVCIFKYRVGSDSDKKQTIPLSSVTEMAKNGLNEMQNEMYMIAKERLMNGIRTDASYEQMKEALLNDEASSYPGRGLFLVPWKCNAIHEATIKEECKATIRCYPLDANEQELFIGKKCFYSGQDATHMALFGRAF